VFCEVAYRAVSVQNVVDGIDEFLDELIVLPPSIWDPKIRLEPPLTSRSKVLRRYLVVLIYERQLCCSVLLSFNLDHKKERTNRHAILSRVVLLKAKFHYAIAGSKLVRSWSPTSFEPASVMEFGFVYDCRNFRTRAISLLILLHDISNTSIRTSRIHIPNPDESSRTAIDFALIMQIV